MNSEIHKCIFCLEESRNFSTQEHIISESLGNTDDILLDSVCDKCQNYLGQEVERFVLSKTPFAFWKTLYGTKTKNGKSPFCDLSLDKKIKGRLANFHPHSDKGMVIHAANFNDEAIINVDFDDDNLKHQILNGDKRTFNLVLTPKILVYIGRFLGKIALEYGRKEFEDDVFSKRFDDLRNYVRFGTTSKMWPIFNCKLKENLLFYKDAENGLQKRDLYHYALYQIKSMDLSLFLFDIGNERYGILLDKKYPEGNEFTDEFLGILLQDTDGAVNILYYDNLSD